jgi:hypothetical protein
MRGSPKGFRALLSWFANAGLQPPHNLPVWIADWRNSLHRLLGERLGLRFALPLVFQKSHPLADYFSARLMFWLHAQHPLVSTVADGNMEAALRGPH